MKKHILSMILALTVLAGSMTACQAPEENKAPGITVASSDAQPYAEWLTERLTTVNESVVIGIGNSDEYDADMTDFEDDGYVIKEKITILSLSVRLQTVLTAVCVSTLMPLMQVRLLKKSPITRA